MIPKTPKQPAWPSTYKYRFFAVGADLPVARLFGCFFTFRLVRGLCLADKVHQAQVTKCVGRVA